MPTGRLVRLVADKNQVCSPCMLCSPGGLCVSAVATVFKIADAILLFCMFLSNGVSRPDGVSVVQQNTHFASGRPYGLGLLVVGHDITGPCLFETCPSGQFWQCKAMALGARSQAAKTYLERKLDEFPGAGVDELVLHALLALQVCYCLNACRAAVRCFDSGREGGSTSFAWR